MYYTTLYHVLPGIGVEGHSLPGWSVGHLGRLGKGSVTYPGTGTDGAEVGWPPVVYMFPVDFSVAQGSSLVRS